MPLLRGPKAMVFFAHIPKTGGSAIEAYMAAALPGSVAFLDQAHYGQEPGTAWSRTSPQHIPGASAARLFPERFVDAVFATTRHPVDRFLSAFRYQKYVDKTLPAETDLETFVMSLEYEGVYDTGPFDNHFLAANRFLMPNRETKLFRLEDGLEAVQSWLDDEVIGSPAHRKIEIRNSFVQRVPDQPAELRPSKGVIARIEELYAADFARFGYRRGEHRAHVAD